MSLYPSLEDMMVHSSTPSGVPAGQQQPVAAPSAVPMAVCSAESSFKADNHLPTYPSLYPSLGDMGLEVSPEVLQEHHMAVSQLSLAIGQPQVTAPVCNAVAPATQSMVAPVSGQNEVGMMRAEIKQGVRMVILCKDAKKKVGLAIVAINKGMFVAFVHKDSPAAMAGLRFGDQILQINGTTVAGYKVGDAAKLLEKAAPERIELAMRDRPFERTITLQKDSNGHVGFGIKKGSIHTLVKGSSAARNGVLTDHQVVEVNGRNVVGLSDDDTVKIFQQSPTTITITIMPHFVYSHLIKHVGSMKKYMDRSVPEL